MTTFERIGRTVWATLISLASVAVILWLALKWQWLWSTLLAVAGAAVAFMGMAALTALIAPLIRWIRRRI